jgi:ParB family transcriptional regulator, chromosome partitioning protein
MNDAKSDQDKLRRPALGRGLAALIPSAPLASPREGVLFMDVERIKPDPRQPRQHFDPEALEELSQSIREQGILQPVLLRRGEDGLVLVAGERRWRAAQRAGLKQIPAMIKDLSEAASFAVALVENLQRQDLTPLEEAEGYRRLLEDHGLTQEDLAKQLGRDRSTIANTLRLLKLPAEVRAAVAGGKLSMGHARALLGLSSEVSMVRLARLVMADQLSVRQTEARVRAELSPKKAKNIRAETPNVRHLRESLQRALGCKVGLRAQGEGGIVELHYGSLDDLDRLVERLVR